ncbi:MAG: Cna B-type domain-containing protein, partial [Clostridia bacterium]|nr:Cna B-type domain-containing protein [Clostridia bacterium]
RDPWCEWAGGYIYVCKACKKEVFEEDTPALGHDWAAWTVTKAATCTEKGTSSRTCNRCHKVETQPISALGHIFSKKVYVRQADCEHYGVFYWVCERCGAHSENGSDKPLSHDWDGGVITKQPTKTEEGEIVYTCLRDPSHIRTETLPAKGNSADTTYRTVKIAWNDSKDKAGLRPAEVRVDFIDPNGDNSKVATVTAANGWTYTVNGLPAKDSFGYDIEYRWEEHIEDLPELYKYTGTDAGAPDTVITNGYYPSLNDPRPSLRLSVEIGTLHHMEGMSAGEVSVFIDTVETVTNTGNIPLFAQGYYWLNDPGTVKQGYCSHLLAPGEKKTDTGAYRVGYDGWENPTWDSMFETPDSEEFVGYYSISIFYRGYPIEKYQSELDPDEALCESNVCTVKLMVPREGYTKKGSPGADLCRLTLDSLGETEAVYTLHTCSAHLETAEAAEQLSLAGDWAGAAELWKAEIDKLYEDLAKDADPAVGATLNEDKEAFFEYAEAVQALFGDEEAAELLRLRCAEMCCVLNTAPAQKPSSLTGKYAALDTSETFDVSSREIGTLDGSDCKVTERYSGLAAEALAAAKTMPDQSADAKGEVPAQGLDNWETALDETVNAAFKNADKSAKALIAAWSMYLNVLRDADEALYTLLYSKYPSVVDEHIMDLYKEAALLIGGMK